MSQLSALQRDVPRIDRDDNSVRRVLRDCPGIDLLNEIRQRLRENGDCTILDPTCGAGRAIEGFTRLMDDEAEEFYEEGFGLRGKPQSSGIGIDLTVQPQLIPSEETEGGLMADIHDDDVRTLTTIPDGSVDIVYSISGFHYVDDTLAALKACWRVLKPGGVLVIECPWEYISHPPIREILRTLPDAQHIQPVTSLGDRVGGDIHFLVGRKPPEGGELDFPYQMKSVCVPFPNADNFRKHIVIGQYELIDVT